MSHEWVEGRDTTLLLDNHPPTCSNSHSKHAKAALWSASHVAYVHGDVFLLGHSQSLTEPRTRSSSSMPCHLSLHDLPVWSSVHSHVEHWWPDRKTNYSSLSGQSCPSWLCNSRRLSVPSLWHGQGVERRGEQSWHFPFHWIQGLGSLDGDGSDSKGGSEKLIKEWIESQCFMYVSRV